MLSIQSQHLCNILNGKKTLEIRRTVPKGFVGLVYLYCTKGKPYLFNLEEKWITLDTPSFSSLVNDSPFLNGKVVARFRLDKMSFADYTTIEFNSNLLKEACLTEKELIDYIGEQELRGYSKFYCWHIKKLEIFDEPKELGGFYTYDNSYDNSFGEYFEDRDKYVPLKRSPQSWQYCYAKEE